MRKFTLGRYTFWPFASPALWRQPLVEAYPWLYFKVRLYTRPGVRWGWRIPYTARGLVVDRHDDLSQAEVEQHVHEGGLGLKIPAPVLVRALRGAGGLSAW